MDWCIMTGMSGVSRRMELEDGLLPRLRRTKETGTKINFLPDDGDL